MNFEQQEFFHSPKNVYLKALLYLHLENHYNVDAKVARENKRQSFKSYGIASIHGKQMQIYCTTYLQLMISLTLLKTTFLRSHGGNYLQDSLDFQSTSNSEEFMLKFFFHIFSFTLRILPYLFTKNYNPTRNISFYM